MRTKKFFISGIPDGAEIHKWEDVKTYFYKNMFSSSAGQVCAGSSSSCPSVHRIMCSHSHQSFSDVLWLLNPPDTRRNTIRRNQKCHQEIRGPSVHRIMCSHQSFSDVLLPFSTHRRHQPTFIMFLSKIYP